MSSGNRFDFKSLLPHLLNIRPVPAEMSEDIYEWLSPVNRTDLADAMATLERLQAVKPSKSSIGAHSAKIGDAFERVVRVMFDPCLTWQAKYNRRTLMAEFDVVLSLQPLSSWVPILKFVQHVVMIEAKGHKSAPKTEWVNEMMGLLSAHNSNTGFLVLARGNKKVDRHMRMAIAMHAAKGYQVVPFGRRQIDSVINGRSLLGVLSEQYLSASTHTADLSI